MTVDLLPLLLHGVPAGDVLSGTWAVLSWLGDAAVWLLDQGLLVALATAAAAFIAWQAHKREERRLRERTLAADAEVAGLAYALVRQVAFWTRTWPQSDSEAGTFGRWIIEEQAGRAEARVLKMLSAATEASPEVERAAGMAAVDLHKMIASFDYLSRPDVDADALGVGIDPELGDDKELTPAGMYSRAMKLRASAIENLHEAIRGEFRKIVHGESD